VTEARERRLLSVLVPVYNEAENLPPFYERLRHALRTLEGWDWEIIFVDDGSQDESLPILRTLHERDPAVKILRLSRNFGAWNTVIPGILSASGDAVTWLSADLQDPPEVIPQLARKWEEGAEVVWAVRQQRNDPWLRRVLATLFYRVLRRIAFPGYPLQGMDVCLLDSKVARLFAGLKERTRFSQGLILNLGFAQATVPYVRERRRHGRSKWGRFSRLTTLAVDAIIGFSALPLRLILSWGLLATTGAVVLGGVLLGRIALHQAVAPWQPIALAVLFLSGINAFAVGVLGEYLWRVTQEVRERPLYVVRERIGFASGEVAERRDRQVYRSR